MMFNVLISRQVDKNFRCVYLLTLSGKFYSGSQPVHNSGARVAQSV